MRNPFESNPAMAEESVFETEEKAELKLLQTGDKVRVLRSSGEVEDDWNIIGFDSKTGNAQVGKKVEGRIYSKTISKIELYALNAPEGSSVKFPVKDWISLYKGLDHAIPELPSEVSENDLLTTKEARVLMGNPFESNPTMAEESVSETEGQTGNAQQEKSEKVEELKEARQELENFQIETIEDKDAEKILEKVEIHGDDFMGKFLTPKVLKEEGLLPKHKIRIGDSVVWFSSSGYELGKGRVAVVAYVEKEGKVTARSYYRSNSQGVWRYLPNYTVDEDGEMNWYGKGHSEESITLPVVMQKALSKITREDMPVLKLKKNPNFIFAGTAPKFGNKRGEYYREIEESPRRLEGGFYAERGKKTPPEQIRLSSEQSPDFSKLLTSWEQKTSVYGQVAVEVFPSRDGLLKFMFCKDAAGRVWIGGVEDNSEIQSTGLKKSWIKGGDLVTPAFEYTSQTGGYGNEKMRNRNYVDMYENYLKKIPIIQEYLKASTAHQPEKRPMPIPQAERQGTIGGAQSFAELYQAIEQAGGLQGSQQFYQPAELRNIIERVRKGELDTSYITGTGGLRSRVEAIIRIEKLTNKL